MATRKVDEDVDPADNRATASTQRISIDDLERLKLQSRIPGPLPGLPQLLALLGGSLDDDAVVDLGLREKKASPGYWASSKALGIELGAGRDRLIESIFLHSQGHEGHHAWPGDLSGISFSSTSSQLRKLKGSPTRSAPGWERWDEPTGSIHVQYGGNGVLLVTLMAPGTAR